MSASTAPAGPRRATATRAATGTAARATGPTAASAGVAAPAAAGRRVTATARDAVSFLTAGVLGGTAAGLVTWWVMSNVTIPIHI